MKDKELKTEVEVGEFKGSPTIHIYELDDEGKRKAFPFGFGKKKAKLILRHLKEIEEFANGK
jgi:hypothetical protein